MFSLKKLLNFTFSVGHKTWRPSFFFFFNSAPASCKFCLLGLKMFRYFLSDGEFYLVIRYIWFIYVFLLISGVFFIFPTKPSKYGYRNAVNSGHLFYFFLRFFHK